MIEMQQIEMTLKHLLFYLLLLHCIYC